MKIKKDDLIAAIEAKRPAVVEADRKALAAHREEVKVIAKERREWARRLAKLPDRQLAELNTYRHDVPRELRMPEGASCPRAMAPLLDATLKSLRMDMRSTLTIEMSNHDTYGQWVVFGDRSETTVC